MRGKTMVSELIRMAAHRIGYGIMVMVWRHTDPRKWYGDAAEWLWQRGLRLSRWATHD